MGKKKINNNQNLMQEESHNAYYLNINKAS